MDQEAYNNLLMTRNKQKEEIYVSVDIEADGRVPGLSSMLSFACAAFDINKNLLGSFSRNLELLDGAKPEVETAKFWNETPENKAAFDATRIDMAKPIDAMFDLAQWCKNLPGTPVLVGYPAIYDFKWIDYYAVAFTGNNPFGFSRGIDVKSFAYAQLKRSRFLGTTKKSFNKDWFDDLPHTHVALDDAIEQGALFINMLRDNLGLPRLPDVVIPSPAASPSSPAE